MTNINGINKMVVGSTEWENIHKKLGDVNNSKIEDDQVLFETMQYYEVSNRSDGWSDAAQELSIEELIEKWKEFDKEDTSFAKDFDDFDAYMSTYKPDEPEVPVDEDIIRPYIPKPLTPEQEQRMQEFDKMRAEDSHANLDKEGDYELLLEYVRQREGTSFLYPSDYNEDGTVNEKGKAKEAEMIAKLAEIDKGDNDIGDILEDFLNAYNVEEPKGPAVNGELPDVKDVVTSKAGVASELLIGDNKYLITNNGADGNTLAYEVKTNKQGEKYIEMNGSDWRIQDISGKLQDDIIQINGENNELDLGLGDDIAYLVGDNNRALMGDGDDKVYIEGDNAFTDLWRGDDKLFNISSDNTMGVGFTGDDEMYIKGDNVLVSGENNTTVGDGIYKDGKITDHEIENTLQKPDWFPGPDPEGGETTEDTDIEFDGIKYRVYKKTSSNDPTEKLVYYKAEDGRTVFESNGWDITVVSEDNTTGDDKYADVVVKGDRNSFHGSKSDDAIEIQGSDNNIYGDYSHTEGDNDEITIESGTNNYIYGEVGTDSVITKTEGNFFNEAILDVEIANGEEQDLTPPQKESAWKPVTEPNETQLAQMQAARDAFDLPDDATFKKVQQNGSTLGLSYNSQAYLSKTNADGTVASVTKKDNGVTLAKVEYSYDNNGKVVSTKMIDYEKNTITVTDAEGNKTVKEYDDVKVKNPVENNTTIIKPDGTVAENVVVDKENNTITITNEDGSIQIDTYDDVTSNQRKPISSELKDVDGKTVSTTSYNFDTDVAETVTADGTTVVSQYDDLTVPTSLQTVETFDAEGNSTKLDTYKNGKLDMSMPKGNVMSLIDFYKIMDRNNDGNLTDADIRQLYNSTNDPVIKGILSNFTDGSEMTLAYKLAATGSGEDAYVKDKTLTVADAKKWLADANGMITSDKIAQLQTNAAYASLVGNELNNAWYVNKINNDGTMNPNDVAYALTNNEGKDYDDLTMVLLNAAGGNSVNRDDLAAYGITTAEDYQNKELFNKLREGADILAELGVKTKRWGFATMTAQQILEAYDKATDDKVKQACLLTGMIEVGTDGLARIVQGKTGSSKLEMNPRELYNKVLTDIVEYPNLKKEEENVEEA